jgi:hypothetical protein
MGTYLGLQTNIANDLTRSDLTSQIQSAIADAISFYEPDRFWFNQTRSLTFSTNAGQNTYTATDLAQIPNIIEFDHVFIRDSVSQWALTKQEYADFEWLLGLNTANGRPTDYCYVDGTIILWPQPNAVYTVRPHIHYRLAPLVNPTDSSAWCTEAERLIRAHAKLILYTNVLEDDTGSQRMQLQLPALRSKLDEETTSRLSTGRIHGTRF